jgi:hypothetical protein
MALGFSDATSSSTPARSRMSSSWCAKPGSVRDNRCWFHRVSPAGPKNTAR